MAYIDQWNPQKFQSDLYGALQPAAAGGASGDAPASPAGAQAPPQASAQPVGTGYVNAGTYLAANQGAGQQMAGTVAQGVEKEAGGFKADLGSYMSDFGKAVGAPGQGAGYAGPTETQTWQPERWAGLTSKANDASSHAQMAGTQQGLGTLIGNAYGQPGYTAGQRGFDSFLAGGADAQHGGHLQELGSIYGNLSSALTGAATAGNAQATGAAGTPPPPRDLRPSKSGAPDYAPVPDPMKPPKGIGGKNDRYNWGY